MSSIKIVLRKKANKDGTFPIALRIIKDRKTNYIYLGYSVQESDWDKINSKVKKSHPNSARLNNYILKKYSEANDKALEHLSSENQQTAKAIKLKIKPSGGFTFAGQADAYIQRLKEAGKFNQYSAEKSRVKRFKDFVGNDIAFSDITPALLERFKSHLIGKFKVSERTAVNHLVMVRSVFSQAIKDSIIESKVYPFGKGKIKIKFPDSIKIGLTPEEVKCLEELNLTDALENHARNVWLISFYFAGMRVSDVLRLRWNDLNDNRLHYKMGKNNKGGSFSISEKAVKIFEQYKQFQENNEDLIFPDLKGVDFDNKFNVQKLISNRTNLIDRKLRNEIASKMELNKKLTMHIARHTFGNIAGDKIPIQMLQKLYRHTSITTTIGYQANFINKDTDDALDAVINF